MKNNKSDRSKSRRITPWDNEAELTPTQAFISRHYKEHYMQRHPKLEDTGEAELINTFSPRKCPYCNSEALLNLAFQNPKLLRYRDMYGENKGFQG